MTAPAYKYPQAIVSTDQLADNLTAQNVRLFDCTVYLVADTEDQPYRVVSGRADYDSAHIPGAAFIELQDDLSDPDSSLRFTMPDAQKLGEQFAALGVDDAAQVVLYSRTSMQWATRVWWMLRSIGFDSASVLDGGWEKWQAEGRPVSDQPNRYAPGKLTVKPRDGLFVGREAVIAATDDEQSCVINALSATLHAGHSPRYGRPGRIPGSTNVPASGLTDKQSRALVDPAVAANAFAAAGAAPENRAVIYCGGGIAATLDAFVMHQLGYENIAVYDNSLNEWARDQTLPMESD